MQENHVSVLPTLDEVADFAEVTGGRDGYGVYVPPALAEVGDFAQVTRGGGGCCLDKHWQCFIGC